MSELHKYKNLTFDEYKSMNKQIAEYEYTVNRLRVLIQDLADMYLSHGIDAYFGVSPDQRRIAERVNREVKHISNIPCPKCKGEVGHRVNCPDGIAFTKK